MHDLIIYTATLFVGVLLGWFFYQGLWWTTKKGLKSKHPGFLFLASNLVRTGTVVAGFYLLSGGQWERLIAALLGFMLSRIILIRLRPNPVEGKMKIQTNAHQS